MRKEFRIVYGVGVADVPPEYRVSECVFYRHWCEMLKRCYYSGFLREKPAYIGCTVFPEWHRFSSFKAWMESREWQGKVIDKDIMVYGNKIYSPETCIFVEPRINSFVTERKSNSPNELFGACWNKKQRKYVSSCANGKGKNIYLGSFDLEIDAHKAWAYQKIKLVVDGSLGDLDDSIAQALVSRYQSYIDRADLIGMKGCDL